MTWGDKTRQEVRREQRVQERAFLVKKKSRKRERKRKRET